MDIEGLDYNTGREKMRLMAYGRDIQQMVDYAITLPTKDERQKAADRIIDAMKRVVPSQQSFKERTPMLWYHLALLSDFKLDIDYPVEFEHEDRMAAGPDRIDYNKEDIPMRHYGKLLFGLFEQLKTLPDGPLREELAKQTAEQMYRSLAQWGFGSVSKERVVSDLANLTDGVIQMDPEDIRIGVTDEAQIKKANKKKNKK